MLSACVFFQPTLLTCQRASSTFYCSLPGWWARHPSRQSHYTVLCLTWCTMLNVNVSCLRPARSLNISLGPLFETSHSQMTRLLTTTSIRPEPIFALPRYRSAPLSLPRVCGVRHNGLCLFILYISTGKLYTVKSQLQLNASSVT
jgi:hypothetical protein